MGNIDDAVPFFGKGFNKIYPLIMVIYTLLVASNFFGRVIEFFGSWKRFKFQSEEEDMDGFDPSGLIILQKERSWLEQGCKIGEQVIPLARNFNSTNVDMESGNATMVKGIVETKEGTSLSEDGKGIQARTLKEENKRYSTGRESVTSKYAAIREQNRQLSSPRSKEKIVSPVSISLLDAGNSQNQSDSMAPSSAAGLASTWATSMKTGFQSLRANIGAKKFLPLRQAQETALHNRASSSESLDEIFQKLKQRPYRDSKGEYGYDDDEDNTGLTSLGPRR